jgi:signal transduction histidine kinase
MTHPTDDTSAADRWAWLKRLNTTLSTWAATLSWWRLTLLGLIALIAGSIISEHLVLSHQTKHKVVKTAVVKSPTHSDSEARPCKNKTIVIGGKPAVVISEAGCTPEIPASGASSASTPEAAIKIEIPRSTDTGADAADAIDAADEEDTWDTQRTFGGFISDVGSVLLIVFFAYLAAAKIIVRKTAESEAKLQVANDSAEREAMQRQLVQARLKLLQAQVEPHFLFNTLSAVDYLIETDPKRASEMQKLLIGYLRAALPQMRQESSTLGRELALIRPYLELLKLRIEDRLTYDIQVPTGLASTVFPPMVLQTLVENAIKHGIEPKPEGGQVTVSAQVVDGHLQVQVIDTGVGLGTGNIYAASTQGTGLGLDNIRNRLALLYPGASSLELRAGEPCGTVATLTIPYRAETSKAV